MNTSTSLPLQIYSNSSIPHVVTAVAISVQQSLITSVTNVLTIIYTYMTSYLCPLEIILATINCSLCLIVFIFNKDFNSKTSKNSRLYYILLAISDLIAAYTVPIMYFLGDGIHGITNGNFYMYEKLSCKGTKSLYTVSSVNMLVLTSINLDLLHWLQLHLL